TRPEKLYRYSERKWLERSLSLGEFRLRPASHYRNLEAAEARSDNEQHRVLVYPASSFKMTLERTGQPIIPTGDITFESFVDTDYLTLCLAKKWGHHFLGDFEGSDACLVIHEPHEFCERIHLAVEKLLPDWSGIDGPVRYGSKSPLGAAFTKPDKFVFQFEWRFAWLPPMPINACEPLVISIGSIESIAEIRGIPPFAGGT
ncbi:MAG: hypothetical protein ABL859_10325, partial [Methylotenera sp.]